MKTKKSITAPLVFCLSFFVVQVFAQKEIRWIGGFSGQEQDWFCPQNWSTNQVPDEFSNVFIPDVSTTTFSNPVIKAGEASVNSLFIESNAILVVGEGSSLIVHTFLTNPNDRSLQIKGDIQLLEEHIQQPALAQSGHR